MTDEQLLGRFARMIRLRTDSATRQELDVVDELSQGMLAIHKAVTLGYAERIRTVEQDLALAEARDALGLPADGLLDLQGLPIDDVLVRPLIPGDHTRNLACRFCGGENLRVVEQVARWVELAGAHRDKDLVEIPPEKFQYSDPAEGDRMWFECDACCTQLAIPEWLKVDWV